MDMRTTLDIDAPDQAPRRFSTRHMAIGAIALALVAGAGWKTLHQPAKATIAPEIVLGVATPLVSQVVQWDDYVGRFAPSQTVEVRPRVAGQITALHFRDGDIVQKGQILFTVDQRPYRAALAEAQANVASARSALVLAKSDFARVGRLTGDEAVSAGEVDSLRSRVQSAEAALAAALARQQQRALDMEFTQVRAPISGRISDRKVDVGNLVAAGEGRMPPCSPRSTRSTRSISTSTAPKPCSSSPSVTAPRAARLRSRSSFRMRAATTGRAVWTSPTTASTRIRARSGQGGHRQPQAVPDRGHVRQHAPVQWRAGRCSDGAR
jgi:multidrug efflux pump subunit AcrA (membrane-fusion protein)